MINNINKNITPHNSKKGGRPKQDSSIKIELPGVELVILTENQYNILEKKYGFDILSKAIKILDDWMKSGSPYSLKYRGKNNYAHFRSDGWVVNTAKRLAIKYNN